MTESRYRRVVMGAALCLSTTLAGTLLTTPATSSAQAGQLTHARADSDRAQSRGQATWIGRDTPDQAPLEGQQAPAPMLRREFTLTKPVSAARLEIVGLGLYRAWINGQRVGDAALDTGPSQYDQVAWSRSYDVTRLLRQRSNAIGVLLGRGYFSPPTIPVDPFTQSMAPWREEPRLRASLVIRFADGSEKRVVTDASWKIADSPTRDSFYTGEYYDARNETPGWTKPSFDDSSWEGAKAQPSPTEQVLPAKFPPVRVARTLAPAEVETSTDGNRVFDFGRITAGWARLTVTGERGTVVTMTYGEQVDPDGGVAVLPSNVARHQDTYVVKGSPQGEQWEPSFTRHGFQYVEVAVSGGKVEDIALEARENYTDLRRTGTFTTSNPLLQTIHRNEVASISYNFAGFPTDTPWRDRQGWTADVWAFFDSAAMNFDTKAIIDRWLLSYKAAQHADGTMPEIVPDPSPGPGPFDNDPSWGGSYIFDVWRHYQLFGDSRILETHYESMARWVDLMNTKIQPTGDLYLGYSFGDWASPGSEIGGGVLLVPKTGSQLTANADLYQEVRTLAGVARLLNEDEDAERFEAMAQRIRTAFNTLFFDPLTQTYRTPVVAATGYQQTSNVVALAYDMVPKGSRAAIVANLVKAIKANGNNLDTGAIGTRLLLPALTESGHGQLAYEIATQRDYPSWGYWVEQGATSSWETWDIEGQLQSKNHAFLGTIEEWFYQYLAGIRPTAPGYSKISVAPIFPTGLQHAGARQRTAAGTITSTWKRGDGSVTLVVRAPSDATTTVTLPVESRQVLTASGREMASDAHSTTYSVEPGRHVFRVNQTHR